MDIKTRAKQYAEDMDKPDDWLVFGNVALKSARYVAFKAGAEWQRSVHSKKEAEKFAKNNLGSLVLIDVEYSEEQGVIVGYSEEYIIIAVDTPDGWRSLSEKDVLLIHSPAYKYFWYEHMEDLKFI